MKHLKLFAGALLALTAPAAAQWSDNFDSYASNTLLSNVGGWFGWDNTPAAAGTADSAFARSAPNSLRCGVGADAVHPSLGITSGKWRMTSWQYIPTGGLTGGPVYFILNNSYAHGGPYSWSTEIQCTPAGSVVDDLRPHTPLPVVFDQWVEYRLEIDLVANTLTSFYNGCQLSSGVYNIQGGAIAVENIDLFSNGGTCYWDDIILEQPWSDNFDSYATNTSLSNVGGWFGWDNAPAAAGTAVSTFALSAPNSMLCGPGADAVHPSFGRTSGQWTMTAWQYVPTGGLSAGPVYFILNNVYNHGGPYTWTTQLQCTTAGMVTDDLRTSTPQPVAFDQWAEFRLVIDLGANTVSNYYNGALISTGVYATAGPVALDNVDLYSAGGTCYWDNIAIERTPPALAVAYGTGCAGTAGLVPVIGATGLPVSGSTSFAVTLSQALANVPAALLFSPVCSPVSFGSCTLYIGLPALTLGVPVTSGAGTASVPLSIPSSVSLGANAFMQWIVIDPNGAYFGLAFSSALRVQIGQ